MVFNLSEGFASPLKRGLCTKKCFLQEKNAFFETESEIWLTSAKKNGTIAAPTYKPTRIEKNRKTKDMKTIAIILGLTATVAVGNTLPPTPEAPVATVQG